MNPVWNPDSRRAPALRKQSCGLSRGLTAAFALSTSAPRSIIRRDAIKALDPTDGIIIDDYGQGLSFEWTLSG